MNNELIFDEDIKGFNEVAKKFNKLQDTDYHGAYTLHKEALAQYDRWSTILFEIRKKELVKQKDPALKDRIESVLKILSNIYTSSRMVWSKAKEDMNYNKY